MNFQSILYSVTSKVARITLNRPQVLNAIDELMPSEIQNAVDQANLDDDVKIIVITGAGKAFCSGYDLKKFAQGERGETFGSQKMPWDPYIDYKFMGRCTNQFMSLWHSLKPTVAHINGDCVAGGTDIALCCDVTFIADDARIGYPPARVWGCPTGAMWYYRLGLERAKRMLFTGELISGEEAVRIGLLGESAPRRELAQKVEAFIESIIDVPTNQLFFQKQVINNACEMQGLITSQRLATFFDGMTRHTPEGVAFQEKAKQFGFKQAIHERDQKSKL